MEQKLTEERILYHKSMMRTQVKKKRECIKCRKPFITPDAGTRYCSDCSSMIENYGVVSEFVVVS